MNCRTQRKRISLYFDGRLRPGDAAGFEQHLASCGSCRREFHRLEASLRTLDALPPIKASAGGCEKLLAAIADDSQATRAPMLVWKPAFAVAAVVLTVACAALALHTWAGRGAEPTRPVAERIEAPATSPEQPASVYKQTAATVEQPSRIQAKTAPAVSAAAPKPTYRPLREPVSVQRARKSVPYVARVPTVRRDEGSPLETAPVSRIALEPDPESAEPSDEPRDLSASTAQMVSEGLGPLVAAAQVEEDSLEWISDIEVEDWL